MDEVVILHISDLHFGISEVSTGNRRQEYVRDRQEETLNGFFDTLKNLSIKEPNWKPQIVVISGDIGWQGGKEDYEQYRKDFLSKLIDILEIEEENIITCPGNHDIMRGRVERINRHPKDAIDQGVPELTKEEMKAEADFFQNYVETLCNNDPEKICQAISLKNWPWITFMTLNSAWDCRKDPDEGRLRVGLKIMEALMRDVPSENCLVTIFHHPHTRIQDVIEKSSGNHTEFVKVDRQWLHVSEREPVITGDRTFSSFVEEKSTYILNGHIHQEKSPEVIGKAIRLVSGTVYSDDTPRFHCRLLKIYHNQPNADVYRDMRHRIGAMEEGWDVTNARKVRKQTEFEKHREKFLAEEIEKIIRSYRNENNKEAISQIESRVMYYLVNSDDNIIEQNAHVTDNLQQEEKSTKEKTIDDHTKNNTK